MPFSGLCNNQAYVIHIHKCRKNYTHEIKLKLTSSSKSMEKLQLSRMYISSAIMENNMTGFEELKTTILWSTNPTLEYILTGHEIDMGKRHPHALPYHSALQYSQEVEIISVFFNQWTGKVSTMHLWWNRIQQQKECFVKSVSMNGILARGNGFVWGEFWMLWENLKRAKSFVTSVSSNMKKVFSCRSNG